jgi:hypothetical protein
MTIERKPDRSRVPAAMRARGCTAPHPTQPHVYRLGRSNLYLADLGAVMRDLARETPAERARHDAEEDARHAARRSRWSRRAS